MRNKHLKSTKEQHYMTRSDTAVTLYMRLNDNDKLNKWQRVVLHKSGHVVFTSAPCKCSIFYLNLSGWNYKGKL